MLHVATCIWWPALVTQSILAESIQERWSRPSAAACRRAQRIAALTDQHPGPQQPCWAHGRHHGPTLCSPMHLAPYQTGALIHHQAIGRDIRSFPRKKYYQLGLIFTVLKLTLANVIAWCTDLSNLFSAAVPKHIIIVCCVSKAGLGFHVTVL